MQKKIILGLIILFFAVGVGYYIYRDLVKHSVSTNKSLLGYPIAKEIAKEIPNLDRSINITANLPEDAKKIAKEKIEKLSSELKQNPNLFENWLVLGIYRKMLGDFEGAKECWEYVAALNPKSSIPFNNLGDLYAYYLKDYKKAEENFLIAIENGPDQIYIYRSLYDFYRYVIKDEAKAKEILRKGIEINPSASDLQELLNSF